MGLLLSSIGYKAVRQVVMITTVFAAVLAKSKLSLWYVKRADASHYFPCPLDVFPGGLLQPPVRMMPQPQPVRRIEPPPRFPSRNDRGPELILRTKEERR